MEPEGRRGSARLWGSNGAAPQGSMSGWRDDYLEANRANWDERVPIHAEGEFYDVASFKEGQERLRRSSSSRSETSPARTSSTCSATSASTR